MLGAQLVEHSLVDLDHVKTSPPQISSVERNVAHHAPYHSTRMPWTCTLRL